MGGTTGNFVINNDAASTDTTSVTLNMSVSGATDMRFGNSAAERDAASWVTYNTSYPWTLSAGEGSKTVYAEFRNASNVTGIVEDSINFQTMFISFTGSTPDNNTISSGTSITAQTAITTEDLKSITWTIDTSSYVFDM